jgi:hypothetical protein
MEEELRQMDAANKPRLDLDQLESHFSEFSIESTSPTTLFLPGNSRFSAYSNDTDLASPSSMTSSSTFNNDGKVSPMLSTLGNQSHAPDFSALQKESPASATIPGTPFELIPSPKLATSPIRLSAAGHSPVTTEYPFPVDMSNICVPGRDDNRDHIKSLNDPSNALHFWNDLVRPCDDYPSLPCHDSPFSMQENSGYPTPRADQTDDQYHVYGDGQLSNVQLQSAIQDLLDELSYLGTAIVATSGPEAC